MRLAELELNRFRNYRTLRWEPGAGVNLLLGANAQGKTNLLEAVALLTRGRSKRVRTRTEILMHGERECRLAGSFSDSRDVPCRVSMTIDRAGTRQMLLDGQRLEKTSVLFEMVPTVLQESADVEMLAGPPAGRRAFVDMLCLELSPRYVSLFGQHAKLLRSRNVLLAKARRGRELEVVTELLAAASAKLLRARETAVEALSSETSSLESMEPLKLRYRIYGAGQDGGPEPNKDSTGWYRTAFQARLDEDCRMRTTGLGPHRDDLELELNGRPVRNIASRGQLRDVLLRLKLGEARVVARTRGEMPLLLLDDVFSETDEERRRRLIAWMPAEAQLFLTGTDRRIAKEFESRACRQFEVRSGEVEAVSST